MTIHISPNTGRWHVSLSDDDGVPEPSVQQSAQFFIGQALGCCGDHGPVMSSHRR